MRVHKILHPTDFSESAFHALRLAASLSRAHGATLHVFHATTLHGEHLDSEPGNLPQYLASAKELLTKGGAVTQPPELESSTSRALLPFDGIMQAAEEQHADLIVIGSHGHARFSKLLMGSTAEKVLRHAPCDVLVVKAGAPLPEDGIFRRLMVPVDFSEGSMRGLEKARAIRGEHDAMIYLVHIVEPAPPMYLAGGIESYFELDPDLGLRIETNLRKWAGDVPHSKIMIAEGNPALEIARLSESVGADVIVMSTDGRTGAEQLLLGSVTERVCRFAGTPVFVAR